MSLGAIAILGVTILATAFIAGVKFIVWPVYLLRAGWLAWHA